MTEDNQNLPPSDIEPSEESEVPAYTPASPQKRIWAWVGVVYMVMIVLLITYLLANAALLRGITGLMLAPAIGGIAANSIYAFKSGSSRFGVAGFIILLLLCGIGLVLCFMQGIPALISNF